MQNTGINDRIYLDISLLPMRLFLEWRAVLGSVSPFSQIRCLFILGPQNPLLGMNYY